MKKDIDVLGLQKLTQVLSDSQSLNILIKNLKIMS